MSKFITLSMAMILTLISGSLFSQEDTRGASFGFSLTPKASIQLYENDNIGKANIVVAGSVHFDIYVDISSRIQLKSGIGIQYLTLNQFDYSPMLGCDFDGTSVDITNSFYKTSLNSFYVGIPLGLRFKIAGEENHFFIKLGLENLIKIATRDKVFLHECRIPTIELPDNSLFIPKTYLLLAQVGLGYEFVVGGKKVFLGPVVEFSVTEALKNVESQGLLINNSRPLNIGAIVGIRM